MQAKKYFSIDGDTAQLFLYGEVGSWYDGLTVMDVVRQIHIMHENGVKTCNVLINSGGGYIYDGLAIVNLFRSPPAGMEIHTWNNGTCNSMAGDIFLAVPKERRHMAKNASMLIHSPSISTGKSLTKRAALEMAAMLEKFEEAAVMSMAESTGMTEDAVRTEFYDGGEHMLTHADCLKYGFIDDNGESYMAEKPTTKNSDGIWKSIKKYFTPDKEKIETPEVKKTDIFNALKSGAITRADVESALAEEAAATPMTMADVQNAIKAERTKWEAERNANTTAAAPALTVASTTESMNDPTPAKKYDENRVNNMWANVRDVATI
jgi:ATP-dependent protease ClpP protease subunit